MTARRRPETMKIFATKRLHTKTPSFFLRGPSRSSRLYNKPLGVSLCLRSFVAIFLVERGKRGDRPEKSPQQFIQLGLIEIQYTGNVYTVREHDLFNILVVFIVLYLAGRVSPKPGEVFLSLWEVFSGRRIVSSRSREVFPTVWKVGQW